MTSKIDKKFVRTLRSFLGALVLTFLLGGCTRDYPDSRDWRVGSWLVVMHGTVDFTQAPNHEWAFGSYKSVMCFNHATVIRTGGTYYYINCSYHSLLAGLLVIALLLIAVFRFGIVPKVRGESKRKPGNGASARTVGLLVVTFAVFLSGCTSSASRLGHGYRIVNRTEDLSNVPNAFEGLAHYTDLYYGNRKLGTVGQYSISPSGRYALFEEAGRLVLFNRDTQQVREVTDGAFAIPSNFAWSESAGLVEVGYFEGHAPSRISLVR